MEVSLVPGLYIADIDWTFAGSLATQSPTQTMNFSGAVTGETLTVPLPSIGVQMNYQILDRLSAEARGDFFYIRAGDFKGSLTEVYAGLEYRLFKHFALGAAYNFLNINAEDDSVDGWEINNNWNMVYLYGSLYAFDL